VVFASLNTIGVLGTLIAGCKPPKASSGLSTLMTLMVLVWTFMGALSEWSKGMCNLIGLAKLEKGHVVTFEACWLFVWWFSIYQLLEAAQPPMDKSKGLMCFSLLNVLVILGFTIWLFIQAIGW